MRSGKKKSKDQSWFLMPWLFLIAMLFTAGFAFFTSQREVQSGQAQDGEYTPITFAEISNYPYDFPDKEEIEARKFGNQIPDHIKAMNGKKVVLEGFMMPGFLEWGQDVKNFLLLANQQACCFGVAPFMNEWVDVHTTDGKGMPLTLDVPVKVYGTIFVGEEINEAQGISIYRMLADKVEATKKPGFRFLW